MWAVASESMQRLERNEATGWIMWVCVCNRAKVVWETNRAYKNQMCCAREKTTVVWPCNAYEDSCIKRWWSLTVGQTCGKGKSRKTKWWEKNFRHWAAQRGWQRTKILRGLLCLKRDVKLSKIISCLLHPLLGRVILIWWTDRCRCHIKSTRAGAP